MTRATGRRTRRQDTDINARLIALYWRKDRDMFRVWRHDWFGDQFEVINEHKFDHLQDMCKMFSIPLIDATGDD